MNPREKILVEALQKIKQHTEKVAGPVLCKTNTVWKICDKALREHEKGEIIEARECDCVEVSLRG